MKFTTILAALVGSAATVSAGLINRDSAPAKGGFTKVNPGKVADMIVSKDTLLNGTYKGEKPKTVKPHKASIQATLPFHFVNNFGGDISAYLTGKDENHAVYFVKNDGSLYYPSSGGSGTPVAITEDIKIPIAAGQTLDFTLPSSMESGRVYFAAADLSFGVVLTPDGESIVQPAPENQLDPNAAVNWGFVELTLNTDGSLYANISYVDFVGMPLGMELAVNGGDTQTAFGVSGGAVEAVCNDLAAQSSADGRPWSAMCMGSPPVRALAPVKYHDVDPSGFSDYWDGYVNDVWAKYTNEPLTIDTQGEAGQVKCQVSGDVLNCEGDNRGYNKPAAVDIWGCNSGPFGKLEGDNGIHLAVIPRLCAAFYRSTLLLDGGNIQPSLGSDRYYTVDPTAHYGRIIHAHEVDGKGYAFSYDDVNPSGENASGTVSHGAPASLTVYIGAPPS